MPIWWHHPLCSRGFVLDFVELICLMLSFFFFFFFDFCAKCSNFGLAPYVIPGTLCILMNPELCIKKTTKKNLSYGSWNTKHGYITRQRAECCLAMYPCFVFHDPCDKLYKNLYCNVNKISIHWHGYNPLGLLQACTSSRCLYN